MSLIQFSGGPLTRNGLKSTAHKGVQGLYRRRHERQLGRGKDKTIAKRKKEAPTLPGNETGTCNTYTCYSTHCLLWLDSETAKGSGDVRNIHEEYIYRI